MLKKIRLILALIFGVAFLFSFLTIGNSETQSFTAQVAKTQILPAIMAGSIAVLISLFIITILIGRVYCSSFCPFGIMQDFIDRIIKMKRKWFNWKKKKIGYIKPKSILRYSILLIVAISLICGIGIFANLLDPYSIFGAITTHLVRPVVVFFNNIAAEVLNSMDIYSLYAVHNSIVSLGALIFAAIMVVVITTFVFYRQRLWCNAICPVGTLLGVVSKFSIFKIKIDSEKCTKCKLCSTNCKSNCIDEQRYYVDNSRCVTCFNCIDKCKKGAIKFVYSPSISHEDCSLKCGSKDSGSKDSEKTVQNSQLNSETNINKETITSRSEFLALAATATVVPAVKGVKRKFRLNAARYPLPPGAISNERFQSKCTGCQLCVAACPSHVLKPAMFERGINGFMQPYLSFDVHKFCEFECKTCMDVCPNNAITNMTLEEKKLLQIGVVKFNINHCVVKTDNQYCGACAEHCPTQAVHMAEYKNGLTIPTLEPEICIGCGACESICPVRPNAIYVVGRDVQIEAQPVVIEKSKEVEIDGFGF